MDLQAMLRGLFAIPSRIVRALTRVAKWWATPGAGPKFVIS
jgi:hypothetical protein